MGDSMNEVITQYFFETSNNDSTFLTPGRIEVIATKKNDKGESDLVALRFIEGKEIKGYQLYERLRLKPEKKIAELLLTSDGTSIEKQLKIKNVRISNSYNPRPIKNGDSLYLMSSAHTIQTVNHDSSIVGTVRFPENLSFRFKNEWGFEWKIGNDEIGYPLWTSGDMAFLILYKRIKIGLQAPSCWGQTVGSSIENIMPPRQINGTFGLRVDVDAGYAGGTLVVAGKRRDPEGAYAALYSDSLTPVYILQNSDTLSPLYTIRLISQLWYSFLLEINDYHNLLRMRFGLGFHQVGYDAVSRKHEFFEIERPRTFLSPYIKAEYLNQQFTHRFGASAQYYGEWILGTLWLEILRYDDLALRVEIKGGAPVLRNSYQWEPKHFLYVAFPLTYVFGR
jgi:hypothetical protein